MFDFNKPNIEITDISDDKKYGRFVVEPLERGYGTPSILTWLIAEPGKDESIILLRELPNVVP